MLIIALNQSLNEPLTRCTSDIDSSSLRESVFFLSERGVLLLKEAAWRNSLKQNEICYTP